MGKIKIEFKNDEHYPNAYWVGVKFPNIFTNKFIWDFKTGED